MPKWCMEIAIEQNWYFAIGNQKYGPHDKESLVQFLKQGTITHDSLVWRKGMSGWRCLSNVDEFKKKTNGSTLVHTEEPPQFAEFSVPGIDSLNLHTTEPQKTGFKKRCLSCSTTISEMRTKCIKCSIGTSSTTRARSARSRVSLQSQAGVKRPIAGRLSGSSPIQIARRPVGTPQSSSRFRTSGQSRILGTHGYPTKSPDLTAPIIALVSAAIGIIGMFLPWYSYGTNFTFNNTTKYFGYSVDGFLVSKAFFEPIPIFICLLGMLIIAVVALAAGGNAPRNILGWITAGLGGLAVILFIVFIIRTESAMSKYGALGAAFRPALSIGFFMVLLGSLAAGVGGIIMATSAKVNKVIYRRELR